MHTLYKVFNKSNPSRTILLAVFLLLPFFGRCDWSQGVYEALDMLLVDFVIYLLIHIIIFSCYIYYRNKLLTYTVYGLGGIHCVAGLAMLLYGSIVAFFGIVLIIIGVIIFTITAMWRPKGSKL